MVQCEFCRVKSYLCTKDVFRYVLPNKAPPGKELFYIPYWRFRGMLFSCVPFEIREKWIDVSHQAIDSHHFPHSLGFRSQALKMRFVTVETEGTLLHATHTLPQVLNLLANRFQSQVTGPVYHQAHIGENLSLIYSPYYYDGKLVDAVLNEPARHQPDELDIDLNDVKQRKWALDFLPTLCPNCGWDMDGERDALVLHCRNCNSAWQSHKDRFAGLKFGYIPLDENTSEVKYLPFWRIRAEINGVELDSFADLLKVANLPRVPQPDWHTIPFHFWSLAFKIRPQTFIPLATRLTLRQPHDAIVAEYPDSENIHPVNLPILEAVEALKITLANFMTRKRTYFPLLDQIQIRPKSYRLVYLPFIEKRIELLQPMFSININKSQLFHAKNL